MKTFKVLSALLSYPSEALLAGAPEFAAVLDAEQLLPAAQRRELDALIAQIAGGEIYDLQERYGLLFDRTRSLALHLFEHVHGESRDRGQAMVDLRALYERGGVTLAPGELPDAVPVFLEFLSTQPFAQAQPLLAQPLHIFAALAERLKKRGSSYAAVFDALCAIAAVAPDRAEVEALLKGPDPDPNDLAALDAAWEEEEVRFGPGAQGQTNGCGKNETAVPLSAIKIRSRPAATQTHRQDHGHE